MPARRKIKMVKTILGDIPQEDFDSLKKLVEILPPGQQLEGQMIVQAAYLLGRIRGKNKATGNFFKIMKGELTEKDLS